MELNFAYSDGQYASSLSNHISTHAGEKPHQYTRWLETTLVRNCWIQQPTHNVCHQCFLTSVTLNSQKYKIDHSLQHLTRIISYFSVDGDDDASDVDGESADGEPLHDVTNAKPAAKITTPARKRKNKTDLIDYLREKSERESKNRAEELRIQREQLELQRMQHTQMQKLMMAMLNNIKKTQ